VVAFTRQALQPYSICEQQVVKRAVKAAEEDADVKLIGLVRQIERCRIQAVRWPTCCKPQIV